MDHANDEWVLKLDAFARPLFERTAANVRRAHPACRIETWFGPIGSATSYQGWDLGLECSIVGDGNDLDRTVTLIIDLGQLGSATPRLAARLDGPDGLVLDLFPETTFKPFPTEGTRLTDETWGLLVRELPTMLERFESEVRRLIQPR